MFKSNKIMLLGLFILSFIVSITIMHKFFPKQPVQQETTTPVAKTAYFTVWSDKAFTFNKTLKHLSEELSKTENGGYATNTTPPRKILDYITKMI